MATLTFSKAFKLKKAQGELDFVDIPLNRDIALFIDPFAISQRPERWSRDAHRTLLVFFQQVVDAIRGGHLDRALELLGHLKEPNETRFGLSKGLPQGAGIGEMQATQLLEAFKGSSAVKTGFLSSLEECELMVEGIGSDKLSDLTTNIIRGHLAAYTKAQCILHGVPIEQVALPAAFDASSLQWTSDYLDLPVRDGRPILLVPKIIARVQPAYDHPEYYRHHVLTFLQADALEAGSSLVRTLKNGTPVVYKKDLQAKFPCSKQFLYEFSRDHPEVLKKYRKDLEELEKRGIAEIAGPEDERLLAGALALALRAIQPGGEAATGYHQLMIGVLEFLFFPNLLSPVKEKEIHDGRKRIDIVMENGARSGAFHRLHDTKKLPCSYVAIECKNYSSDPANPELDQLSGRFNVQRGKLGLLCCRSFRDRGKFIKRCQDTHKDDRGLILPFDDKAILHLLKVVENGKRVELETVVSELIAEVWVS